MKNKMWLVTILMSVFVVGSSLLGCRAAPTLTPEVPFYEGKTIVFVVPTAGGGITDLHGRIMSRWLKQYIPGNPTIYIRNMPGADQLIGCGYVYNTARRDGLTLLVSGAASIGWPMLAMEEKWYFGWRGTDTLKMEPIVGWPGQNMLVANPKVCDKPEDLLKPRGRLIYGVGAVGGATTMGSLICQDILGFKYATIVPGLSGAEERGAFLREEVNVVDTAPAEWIAYYEPWAKEGKAVRLFTMGFLNREGELVRDEMMPEIPTLKEVYERIYGKPPSGMAWEVHKAFAAACCFGKGLLMHQECPQEAITIMREAAVKMAKDPNAQAEFKKMGVNPPIVGDEAVAVFKQLRMKEEYRKWIIKWLEDNLGMMFETKKK